MRKRKTLQGGTSAASKPAVDPFDPDSFKAPDMMAIGDSTDAQRQDQTPVELLVFDMGYVFVDFDWNEVCKGFCAKAGVDRAKFTEVLAHVGKLGYEQGLVTTEQFLSALNEKLSQQLTVDEFRTLWNQSLYENPQM